MKTQRVIFLIAAIFFLSSFSRLFAQNHIVEILEKASDKIKRIERNYGVVEATFADQILDDSSARYNKVYDHYFLSSARYHINAFASDAELSGIVVSIVRIGDDGKGVIVGDNKNALADVTIAFNPTKSDTYYIVVSGNLKEKDGSAFFNIIVDRE